MVDDNIVDDLESDRIKMRFRFNSTFMRNFMRKTFGSGFDRVYTGAMPNRGSWTMRCQSCKEDFRLELLTGQCIVDLAKSYSCPRCKKSADEDSEVNKASWRHVIDFHAKRK
jgi:hypothetical protein